MEKDLIYIEPENDITDIISAVKNAKHQIVVLIPPKKVGILKSSVNFKLIAKAARKVGKTPILVSGDPTMKKLAAIAKVAVTESLDKAPQILPDPMAEEFGKDGIIGNKITVEEGQEDQDEADAQVNEKAEVDGKGAVANEKVAVNADTRLGASADEGRVIIEEKPKTNKRLMRMDKADEQEEAEKSTEKSVGGKIPDFKKYRKFILMGAAALVLLVAFLFWAKLIAPAASISATIKTTAENFTEEVSFTTKEAEADATKGKFFLESKTIKKSSSAEFEATGKRDDGTKAIGKITVTRVAGQEEFDSPRGLNFSIPKGTRFSYGNLSYVTTEDASVNVTINDLKHKSNIFSNLVLSKDASSGGISVVATENGDKYNMEAKSGNWTTDLTLPNGARVTSTAMTGGTSKLVTTVSAKDIEEAKNHLDSTSEQGIREELVKQFDKEYILVSDSFMVHAPKVTSSPALNEMVANGVKPKILAETSYSIAGVKKADVKAFIEAKTSAHTKNSEQKIYATGIEAKEGERPKAFFENFKQDAKGAKAKLKSTVLMGPVITEEMILEKALGRKIGEVRSQLESLTGVTDVKINTSFFFVHQIPKEKAKVKVDLLVK